MTKLEELIKELCPNGVERVLLEKCCEILDNRRKPITRSARTLGEYPYYGANGIQDYVNDYIFDGEFVLVGEDGSVIDNNGHPIVTWASGKIWVNNHAHIIQAKKGVSLRYLFHYIQTIDITSLVHGNIPKLTGGDFRNLQIPLPPLAVQCEIVRILDDFTSLSAELEDELAARRKQYECYRDKLLSFDKSNEGCEVRWLKLGEICDTITDYVAAGSFADLKKNVQYLQNADYAQLVRTTDLKSKFKNEDFVYIAETAYNYLWRVHLDEASIIMPNIGNCGEVYYVDPRKLPYPKNALGPNAILLRSSKEDNKYLYYIFQCEQFQKQLKLITSPGGQCKFNKTDLKKLIVPIPPLEVQGKIVETLDKFDKLCNDPTEGLPAEIEARQKQYEYYRDKLLSFKECV